MRNHNIFSTLLNVFNLLLNKLWQQCVTLLKFNSIFNSIYNSAKFSILIFNLQFNFLRSFSQTKAKLTSSELLNYQPIKLLNHLTSKLAWVEHELKCGWILEFTHWSVNCIVDYMTQKYSSKAHSERAQFFFM